MCIVLHNNDTHHKITQNRPYIAHLKAYILYV
nr:MAG TPA: hypothetical protein [Caudoviricetes sp.]